MTCMQRKTIMLSWFGFAIQVLSLKVTYQYLYLSPRP